MTVQKVIEQVNEALRGVSGVVGVVLGGSRARGTHQDTSDVDIGIYYDESAGLDLETLSEIATKLDDQHRENLIYAPGQWGPMNGDRDAIFKALGDPTRRLMLDELSERNEMTLYELTARLIMKHQLSISRQAIAKHLSVLEQAGLVQTKRKGKFRVIAFNRMPLESLLKRWLEPEGR